MFPTVSSDYDTDVEEERRRERLTRRRRRRQIRAATLLGTALRMEVEERSQQAHPPESTPPRTSPESTPPPTSPRTSTPPAPPLRVLPISPLRSPPTSPIRIISSEDEDVGVNAEATNSQAMPVRLESEEDVGANVEVTSSPAMLVRLELPEINLLREQIFLDGAKCPICMEGREGGSKEHIIRCSKCNTDYHGTCLLSWTINTGTCPTCRAVEDIDCVFAKIKVVMPLMTTTEMMEHIIASATNEELSELNNRVAAKLLYDNNGDGTPF